MAVSGSYLSTVMARAIRPLASSAPAIRRVVAPARRSLSHAPISRQQAPAAAKLSGSSPSPRVAPVEEQPTRQSAPAKASPISAAQPKAPPISTAHPRSRQELQPVVMIIPKEAAQAEAPVGKLRLDHPGSKSSPPPAPEVHTTVIRDHPGPPPEREVELHVLHEEVPTPAFDSRSHIDSPSASPEPRSYRVRWPDNSPAVSEQVRERVEREVIHTARTQWRDYVKRAAGPAPSSPVVDIHVGQVTVKIEAPPQPAVTAVQPAQPPRASEGDEGFSSYFLRRSISGF